MGESPSEGSKGERSRAQTGRRRRTEWDPSDDSGGNSGHTIDGQMNRSRRVI